MRLPAVMFALVLVTASQVGAQTPASRPAEPVAELSTDWGVWTEIEIGATLTEARAIVQESVGVALAPVSAAPSSALQTYEARYTRGKVKVVEELDILKSSGRVARMRLSLASPLACEGLVGELTEALGAPQPQASSTISFGGTENLVWTDTDNDERILLLIHAEGRQRLCDGIVVTPYKRTY